jgi:hypothetical protein
VQKFTPVVPSYKEAQVRGSLFQASTDKEKFTRLHLNGKNLGMVVHACLFSNDQKPKIGI